MVSITVVSLFQKKLLMLHIFQKRHFLGQQPDHLSTMSLIRTAKQSAQEPSSQPLVVCITGSSSGIGLASARRLIQEGHEVYHANRSVQRCQDAIDAAGGGKALVCDVSDFDSIQQCAQQFPSNVHVLCLNAGVAPSTKAVFPKLTQQGFEECIGVNHLGHFLLANLLFWKRKLPQRIVVTSSAVHDPSTPGGRSSGKSADLGDLSGLGVDLRSQVPLTDKERTLPTMIDGSVAYHGGKIYKDSKLCNILFCQQAMIEFNNNPKRKQDYQIVSFNPGFIPTTGLFDSLRQRSPLFAWALTTVADWRGWSVPVQVGGDRLYSMIVTPINKNNKNDDTSRSPEELPNGAYCSAPVGSLATKIGSEFGPTTVSQDAQNADLALQLWQRSLEVVNRWIK